MKWQIVTNYTENKLNRNIFTTLHLMKYVKDTVHFMANLDSSKMKKVQLSPSK